MDFSKWTDNTYDQGLFKEYYQTYLKQFPSKYYPFIEKAFGLISYYDGVAVSNLCNKLREKIKKHKNFVLSTTIIDNKQHNSATFYRELWALDHSLNAININKIEDYLDTRDLILIDDYSGTANTFKAAIDELVELLLKYLKNGSFPTRVKKYIKIKKWLQGLTITIFPAIITDISMKNISEYIDSFTMPRKWFIKLPTPKFKIEYLESRNIKFISRKIEFNDKDKEILNDINIYCKVGKEYLYGYGGSEELLSLYYGTPNNTLGFLWCETPKNKTKSFFKREQGNTWHLDTSNFKYDYHRDEFISKMIESMDRIRAINKSDKKLLIYLLLNLDYECIVANNKGINIEASIKKLIKNNFIINVGNKSNGTIWEPGSKLSDEILGKIREFQLGLNYISYNKAEEGLTSLIK